MNSINAWFILTLLFVLLLASFAASTPSLLSNVKAHHRMQFANQAEQLFPNWASQTNPYYYSWPQTQPQSYAPTYSQYPVSYVQPNGQEYMMAPPPPPISSYNIDYTEALNAKYKTKALRLVSPDVKRFLHGNSDEAVHFQRNQPYEDVNPILKQKKLQNAEYLQTLKGTRNRGLGLRKEIVEAMSNSTNNNLKSGNKTGLNIHRFRPGKWTNVFSRGTRRRQFQLADAEATNNNETKSDDNLSQIDLLKLNANNTFNTATNATKGKYVPGPRRRYGYKNFKLVASSNSTDDLNNGTQVKPYNEYRMRKYLRNNYLNESLNENGQNLTDNKRSQFGSHLYGKRVFRNYIEKQKFIQLLRNETDITTTTAMTTTQSINDLNESLEEDDNDEDEDDKESTKTSKVETTTLANVLLKN